MKVLFFTAASEPTTADEANIALIEPRTEAQFNLEVRNVSEKDYGGYATDEDYVQPDYVVAGEGAVIPDQYSGVDVLDPAALPSPSLGGDYATVQDGQEIAGTGGTFAVTVVDGVITGGTWTPA